MFVYLITNTINGMRYVGQTNQTLAARWRMHLRKANCRYLHAAILKYGPENFIIEIIVDVPTKELANEFEIEFIDRYCTLSPNGYNILPGGDIRPPMTEEAKQKLSERMKGNKFSVGVSPSEETRKKLSLINIGKTLTSEHKEKIAKSHLGKKHTEESKRKMSLSKAGKPSPRLGSKASEESRRKMSESRKRYLGLRAANG